MLVRNASVMVTASLILVLGGCDDTKPPVQKSTAQPASGGLQLLCNKINGDQGTFTTDDIPPSGISMALRQKAHEYATYHTNKDRLLKACRDEGWAG